MSDNSLAQKMADEYKVELEVSSMKIPKNAPEWVKQMYPPMMSNIINAINGVFKKVVVDFNASFVNLQTQIDDMKKTTDEAMQTMANPKRQLNQRDFIIDDQNRHIKSLRDSLERNET